jgi:hypothetical protein
MKVFEGLELSTSKHESGWHSLIRYSFLYTPPAGMRVASDDLIIELFREIFFSKRSEGRLKRIDPEEIDSETNIFEPYEKYSLYMSRGRKKQTAQTAFNNFYTPLYPTLARSSWLRKQSERTIKNFFFRPIAQHLSDTLDSRSNNESIFVENFYNALVGEKKDNSVSDVSSLQIEKLKGCISPDDAKQMLIKLCGQFYTDEKTEKNVKGIFTFMGNRSDVLAETIYQDMINLCKLEKNLDRLQWMNLFKTFLRLTTSVWLLAQMQMTIILRDKLLELLTNVNYLDVDETWVDEVVMNRVSGLFRPTLIPNTQTDEYIQQYIKARIELNIIVALVEKYSGENWRNKNLTLHSGGRDELGVLELFTATLKAKELISNELGGLSLTVALTRYCEKFPAWRQPPQANKGPAQGYREHLLVLRKMARGDEDGGYLVTSGKRRNSGAIIFPGNLMLKLITYLASQGVNNRQLIFSDVEKHFKKYGVDFGEKGEIRPKLIESMQDMGLLVGSPDAGDSVAVINPYKFNRKVDN